MVPRLRPVPFANLPAAIVAISPPCVKGAFALSYTLKDKNAAAAALVKALPGLNVHAAICWITAEQGVHHNILGVTHYVNGKQTLYQYETWDAGAQAAAAIILSGKGYAGIRESLKRNDIHDQLAAIARSPWHLGANGLKKAGGLDPYYARTFLSLGYDVA